jgi:hypothetical protein
MRFPFAPVVILTIMAGPAVAPAAGEIVKTFPAHQCRYTLPGKDWTWDDPKSLPSAICAARNRAGLDLLLSAVPVPAGTVIDAKFAGGFDEELTSGGPLKKRGGRLTTFRGLPCYESEWLVRGTNTAAIRIIIANGRAYHVQLLGKADPVEKRADFEAIMNGFEFTSPPVPPVAPEPLDPGQKLARRMGQVAVYCLFGALVLGLVVRGARKK